MRNDRRTSLGELALLFLRLGSTAFGGPAAHIAMMEDEVVTRRRWLTRAEFIDLLGATNLIPGPNSTEMAIHVGRARAGVPGLLIAGSCFIAPATLIVAGMAWAYVRYGSFPQAGALLYGIKPVVIAIVFQALVRLGRSAIKTPLLAVATVAAAALALAGVDELIVLFGVGGVMAAAELLKGAKPPTSPLLVGALFLPPAGGLGLGGFAMVGLSAFSRSGLFFVFLKIGSVLFGSGYVLLAFLRHDLVQRLGWLNESQLLDAIAVGQVTPGPVFTTATFIGYVLDGPAGAVLATIGIFLPAFIFVAVSALFLPQLRRSRFFGAALDGVNAASLALMGVVTFELSSSAIVDTVTILLFAASALLLVAFRVNSTWLIFGGAAIGMGALCLR